MAADQHESLRTNPDVQLVEGKSNKAQISFRYLIKNLISVMGLVGVAFFGQVLLILIILDLIGVLGSDSLYGGLITFILMPSLFILSVVFTAAGMAWKYWRTRKYGMEMAIV